MSTRVKHPADAALREVAEETGLRVEHTSTPPTIVHVDVHPGGKGHVHLDVRYLLRAPADDPGPPPGESQAVEWFALPDAIAVADPALRGFLVHLEEEVCSPTSRVARGVACWWATATLVGTQVRDEAEPGHTNRG